MARIEYRPKTFRRDSLELIDSIDEVCRRYARMGYSLTVRQLYYQLVSADRIPNTEKSYDRIVALTGDARMAGLLDWNHIVDRGREAHPNAGGFTSPAQYILPEGYSEDRWDDQDHRIEVWVEKQALEEVVSRVANRHQVGYLACKGYVSLSTMHEASLRFQRYFDDGKTPVILYLGDHDPSGIQMTEDVLDRMSLFLEHNGYDPNDVIRLALNLDQVRTYNPPPNPAKTTDSRYAAYQRRFGTESWELDALRPEVVDRLIEQEILQYKDEDKWQARVETIEEKKEALRLVQKHWDDIQKYVKETYA